MNAELTIFDACNRIESFFGEEFTEEEVLEAWQYLVDTGAVWTLQGSYGRGARRLIDAGLVEENNEQRNAGGF